jgi:hypothetical protein
MSGDTGPAHAIVLCVELVAPHGERREAVRGDRDAALAGQRATTSARSIGVPLGAAASCAIVGPSDELGQPRTLSARTCFIILFGGSRHEESMRGILEL